jgi:type IV secretory pathway VirB2 component (pilin)
LAAVFVVALPGLSRADSVQLAALPWDRSLDTLAALLSGPIAHAFVALALTVAFLIYGLQGNCELARRLFKAGFVTAVALEAVKLLNYLLPY